MASFFIVLLCFLFGFTLHILVHKYFRVTPVKVIVSYIFGAVLLYEFGKTGLIIFPLSSTFLYILFSATIILFYLSISLETELPSSIILRSFHKKERQSLSDLTAHFTDQRLIRNRVDDLQESALVKQSHGAFTLTGRGKLVWGMMEAYRWIFNRKRTE